MMMAAALPSPAAVSVAAAEPETAADHTAHYFPILIVTFGPNSSSSLDRPTCRHTFQAKTHFKEVQIVGYHGENCEIPWMLFYHNER